MDRMIIRLLPTKLRNRYADEIAELLDHSAHPVRDRADLVLASAGLRLDRHLRALVLVALVCVAASGAALIVAISELSDGPAGVFRHWWSTAAVLGVVASLFVATVLVAARQRARAWRAA